MGAERKFSDTGSAPLEEQLNNVLRDIYKTIAATKVYTGNRIEKRKADLIVQERKRLELAQQQEIQRQIEAERHKQELLIAEAGAWAKAEAIRAYSANIIKTASATGAPIGNELQAWLTWTAGVADIIDPTVNRLNETD